MTPWARVKLRDVLKAYKAVTHGTRSHSCSNQDPGHHAPVSSAHTKDPQHTLPPWWLHHSVTLGRPVLVLAIVIVYRCLFVGQCLLFTCATDIVFICVVVPEPVFDNKSALWTCNCLPPVFIVRDRQNPKRGLTIQFYESQDICSWPVFPYV